MSFKKISLSQLCALSAFLVCFAVVFGVGTWLRPPQKEALPAPVAPIVLATLPIEPPPEPVLDAAQSVIQVSAAPEPNIPSLARLMADMLAVPQQIGVSANADQELVTSQSPQQQATFVGVWAPDANSCSPLNFKDGLLPTVINLEGASAGDTFCSFKNQQLTQTGWRIDALCSNKQEQWSTRVHISTSGDRLIWKSKRGAQAYTRCPSEARTAQLQ